MSRWRRSLKRLFMVRPRKPRMELSPGWNIILLECFWPIFHLWLALSVDLCVWFKFGYLSLPLDSYQIQVVLWSTGWIARYTWLLPSMSTSSSYFSCFISSWFPPGSTNVVRCLIHLPLRYFSWEPNSYTLWALSGDVRKQFTRDQPSVITAIAKGQLRRLIRNWDAL